MGRFFGGLKLTNDGHGSISRLLYLDTHRILHYAAFFVVVVGGPGGGWSSDDVLRASLQKWRMSGQCQRRRGRKGHAGVVGWHRLRGSGASEADPRIRFGKIIIIIVIRHDVPWTWFEDVYQYQSTIYVGVCVCVWISQSESGIGSDRVSCVLSLGAYPNNGHLWGYQ